MVGLLWSTTWSLIMWTSNLQVPGLQHVKKTLSRRIHMTCPYCIYECTLNLNMEIVSQYTSDFVSCLESIQSNQINIRMCNTYRTNMNNWITRTHNFSHWDFLPSFFFTLCIFVTVLQENSSAYFIGFAMATEMLLNLSYLFKEARFLDL